MTSDARLDKLTQLLSQQPLAAASLLTALDVSQPTFSRLWARVADGLAVGAGKARQYALRRPVAGVSAPIAVFRIDAAGVAGAIGQLEPLQGGFYALLGPDGKRYRLYQGLPYFMRDLRPQGFLGRMEPGKHADLDLPADILRWSDDHALKYMSRRSEFAPGDLIFGNESYARYLAASAAAVDALIGDHQRAARYPEMAALAMQGEPPGSSAGGEQPKFTAIVQRAAPGLPIDHVIVKFSPPVDTASGRRWADLLVCEHLALEVLAAHGVRAARTAIVEAGNRVFLEVVRFDRAGLAGRLPMATFSAFDGEIGMLDQSWTAVAGELERRGELSAKDARTVEVLDLYGSLIGNTDKHHGNIALSWTFEQRHTLLDAYDMLPMLYRPNPHGEIVPRRWTPHLGANLALAQLTLCRQMAQQFWETVLNDARMSAPFKDDVAAPHLSVLRAIGAH